MSTLFGAYDDNLRQLESLLNVRIRTQGHELLVEGDAGSTAKVARLVEQLGGLIDEGHSISDRDVKTHGGQAPDCREVGKPASLPRGD